VKEVLPTLSSRKTSRKSAPFQAGYLHFCGPIPSITERRSLAPASSTRTALSFPYRSLCHLHGSGTGLPCSVSLTRWRRFRLFPGGSIVRVFPCERGTTHRTPFWFRLVSTFSLFRLTRFIIGSHVLTFPSSLAPDPPWCWQTRSRLTVESQLSPGYIVLVASHPAITRGAWASRLLLTAQQVWLEDFVPPANQRHNFHVALHKIHYHPSKQTFVSFSVSAVGQ